MTNFYKPIIRIAVAAVLATAAMFTASAQTHYVPHVSIGGHAGVNFSRIEFSPSVRETFAMGTTGAVSFTYAEEKLFGIVVELGWANRGWKEDFEESPLKYRRDLTYLTMPILTHISFGTRRFKCFINLGPEFGYMISQKITANFDYNDLASVTDWPERRRMTDQLGMDIHNKFDYGITGGLGFEFYMRPRHSITVEGRYYFGLGNIFRATKADVFSASRCTSIDVTLGYKFRLK